MTPSSHAPSSLSSPRLEEARRQVLARYGVAPQESFDAARAVRDRIDWLKRFLTDTGMGGFVLGISGGVDSTLAGKIAQMACQENRQEGGQARFIALRLPAGVQHDEPDAQAALAFIGPDHTATVNIGPAATLLATASQGAVASLGTRLSATQMDFHKGNVKARLRMAAQYHLAAAHGCAVLGTDHAAEAVMGFFTKFGDGAADVTVLDGLNKRQVRQCTRHLGAPADLWDKPAMADLEDLQPGKLDEQTLGVPYDVLDDFLEGKAIPRDLEERILTQYLATGHKRSPIPGFRPG